MAKAKKDLDYAKVMGKTWIDGKCFFMNLQNRTAVFQWEYCRRKENPPR